MRDREDGGALTKSAYTYDEAAIEVGLSRRAIERETAENRLIASYYRSKPLILHTELIRWLEALPTERPMTAGSGPPGPTDADP